MSRFPYRHFENSPGAIVTAFLCALAIASPSAAGDTAGSLPPAPLPQKAPLSFPSLLADEYDISVSTDPADIDPDDLTVDLEGFARYSFVSRKPLEGTRPPSKGRFSLRTYSYGHSRAGGNAMDALVRHILGSMFYKSPLLLVEREGTLYRLDGACLYSEGSWERIEGMLLAEIVPLGVPNGTALFRMSCGGSHSRWPEERGGTPGVKSGQNSQLPPGHSPE